MNKRIRKKRCLGEFREHGFRVWFRLPAELSNDERNAVLDAFLAEAVEPHGLAFGGGGGAGNVWDGFVTSTARRGSAAEEHRRAAIAWLAAHPRVLEHRVYPLVDAWYGDPFAEVAGEVASGGTAGG